MWWVEKGVGQQQLFSIEVQQRVQRGGKNDARNSILVFCCSCLTVTLLRCRLNVCVTFCTTPTQQPASQPATHL